MTNFNSVVKQTTISTQIDLKETSNMQNYPRAININGSFRFELWSSVQPKLFPTKHAICKNNDKIKVEISMERIKSALVA